MLSAFEGMNRSDPMVDVISLGLPILVLIWFVFVVSVASNPHALRKEARRHTELLEQIAKNTCKPEDGPRPTSSISYMHDEPKVSVGWMLTILAVIGAVLFIIAMARK